ncbi:MAG: F0F1 ATP synthase subunit epsilon [Bacteroidales bacterium]|nr:F0F1 ATP synthase subunit epsilon [Bacteroidales bacterium]MBD5273140.1 F0F1 ATP synthase subunit epsilon [Bacteroides sp.]MBD5273529.1 F0F1 ATP synthase subunit epsilon [Bacteroides sp.]MDE6257686.1 F0F1 ATP synthase subunit epsilon [Muribaculaceae bacterium]
MTLEIISASEITFKGEVDSVTLPGKLGSFTVLKNHAALISVLTGGDVRYTVNGETHTIAIQGGIADVNNNVISVCIY